MTPFAATVRIAAAQYPLDLHDTLVQGRRKLDRWIEDAVRSGAELLVFPEYGAMEFVGAGCGANTDLQASLAAVSDMRAEVDGIHAELSRSYGVHILSASGPYRRADGRFVNRASLFAPGGRSGAQDKCMTTPFEREWGVAPGDDLAVFDTSLGTIGVAICYDSEFPLLVHSLCEARADIILVPSCTEFVSGHARVRTACLARALENGCVAVKATTVGLASWSAAVDRNSGAAGVYVPAERGLSDSGVLAEGTLDTAQWTIATADLDHLRDIRATGEMRNARDWLRQPGAAPTGVTVRRIDLT